MRYVYHAVPIALRGSILYPLSKLKLKYPSVYQKAIEKYAGRDYVRENRISLLNCGWNSVLHLSPIDPRKIYGVLRKLGYAYPKRKYYEIPIKNLDPKKTVVFSYKRSSGPEELDPHDFELLDLNKKYQFKIGERTIAHWTSCKDAGEKRVLYAYLPHVFYKGPIDVSNAKVIEA